MQTCRTIETKSVSPNRLKICSVILSLGVIYLTVLKSGNTFLRKKSDVAYQDGQTIKQQQGS